MFRINIFYLIVLQSYTKVNEKSNHRKHQLEKFQDEVKTLKRKINRLEREKGAQESRLRMKQQSEELNELKAVVEDYKKTLTKAEAVKKNFTTGSSTLSGSSRVASNNGLPLHDINVDMDSARMGVNGDDNNCGGHESLSVTRKKGEELMKKHKQLLLNNVELTMKKAEMARTLDIVMGEKKTAQDEITTLKLHIKRLERAAQQAGVSIRPMMGQKNSHSNEEYELNTSISSIRSSSSRRSSMSTRSHRTHHRSSSKKSRKTPSKIKIGKENATLSSSISKRPENKQIDESGGEEIFRSASDVFGQEDFASSKMKSSSSETMRRFTLSSSDDSAVRKARLMQMREKLGRGKTASGLRQNRTIRNQGGCGNRLRRAARLASHDENAQSN